MSIDFDKNRSHILQVYNDVLDDKSATDWALFGYEAQTNVIKVVGYGDEGLEEMVEELNASKIMYGIIRLLDPKTSRIKIVLLNWQGEAAPNLRKGVCQRHLHDVKKFFKAFNITFNARTEEDVDMEAVLDAVTKGASTEYNFKDRSEIPDKTVPVKKLANQFWSGDISGATGTNYKRTNPVAEIDANRRNKFWEEQEAEERMRKEEEIKKKEEEARRLEKERMERELRDSKQREELNKERNSRILAEKKAEMAAMEITRKRDSVSWEREMVHQRTEEEERARRADQMRMERKKEAESLIGQKTHQARFMFESQSRNTIVTSPATMHSSWNEDSKRGSKPPPRILKEFNPSNVEQNISSPRENSAPRKSVGARWPPPSNMEEITPKAQTKVPGKIAEWAPKTEMPSNSHPQHTNFSQAVIEPVRSPQQPSETVSHPASYSHHTQQTFSQNSSLSNQFFKEEQTISPPHSFSTTPPSASPPGVAPSLSPSHDTPLTHVTASPSSLYSPKSSPSHVITENGSKVKGNGDAQGWCPSSTGQGMKILDPYPTNGTMEERSGDSDVTSPYQDEIDALGSVCMTYEVEGIEYQILPEHGLCARALYDYQAADDTEITFDPGDIITNIDQIDVGWWQGVSALGVFGLFPANYVELINGTKIH